MIIGRQVAIRGGLVDLLAIDLAGAVYVIELKRSEARPTIVAQILRYRRSIKRLNRGELVRIVAEGRLEMDLLEAFQLRFGHPLPEAVNQSQVLVIIAASIHADAAGALLELLDEGYLVTTFRYVNESDRVELIPCCRNDQDVEEGTHKEAKPSASPKRVVAAPRRSKIYWPPDESIRRFWSAHAQDFKPFATFKFIYGRYLDWARAHEAESGALHNEGLFGRDLSTIVAESQEWRRVFAAQRSDLDAYNTVMAPPSVREDRAPNHVVAYLWEPTGRALEPR